MKIITKFVLLTTMLLAGLNSAYAYDYGVELKWNTQDFSQVLSQFPEQRAAFSRFIEEGKIKDMFVRDSAIGEQKVQILQFVMQGESEQAVRDELATLPFFEQELVKINAIQLLGAKWLDNTPEHNNYGLTFTWKEGIEPLEIDRVLGIDLQRVITFNQVGTVTSSYINTQAINTDVIRPTYLVAVLAQDAEHALKMSQQFEAVRLGYADVDVVYLGKKINMREL
ncbi:hypothetical protein WM009_13305 [Vibrio vulnificus]|uniref:hypothetical protein n=1 Tax=Vibrio vulnificus TaxID=672 RepID=UPI0030EE5D11